MTLHDYKASQRLASDDPPFAALIMAALRKADTHNAKLLRRAWPEIWAEMVQRDLAPGGVLPSDTAGGER